MSELLALPGWQTPPTPLDEWVAQLEAHGGPVVVTAESSSVSWLEIGSLRLRGYAMLSGRNVEAINFELSAADPESARRVVQTVADALGWEVHADDDNDNDEQDDDPAT
jgi:hypothetical protein